MNNEQYLQAVDAINKAHLLDIHIEDGQPAESIYAQRMLVALEQFYPQASPTLKLAALTHHFRRWEIERSRCPDGKAGYYQWRKFVMEHQLNAVSEALQPILSADEIDEVKLWMNKNNRTTIPQAQIIEDVACIVFVQFYLEPFAVKHPEEKVIDIIRKTLGKISPDGIQYILQQQLSSTTLGLISKATA